MPEQQIRQIVQDEIKQGQIKDQYGVNRTPVHTHSGLDSPRLDFGSALNNRQVQLVSHVPSTQAATAGNYGHFFINSLFPVSTQNGGMTVITITEVHGRAGNDAGAVTLTLRLLNPGDASLTGGTTITTFDLKGTADTPVAKTFVFGKTPAVVYPGQRLALQTSGTLTNVADVVVTVLLQY